MEALPESFRSVFVLREIEKLDTRDTAECLGITEENVKVRLHRARALIRGELSARMGTVLPEVFRFHLSRCDRVVAAVFERIAGRDRRISFSMDSARAHPAVRETFGKYGG